MSSPASRQISNWQVVLFFLCAVNAAVAGEPAGREDVAVFTDKTAYGRKEAIRISLCNNSSESIYSAAAGPSPDLAIINFEKNKNQWVWDALPVRCSRLECDAVAGEPGQINPGEERTFAWHPRVYAKRGYREPEPGVYRITLMYQARKGAGNNDWIWRTVKSNEFTLNRGGD